MDNHETIISFLQLNQTRNQLILLEMKWKFVISLFGVFMFEGKVVADQSKSTVRISLFIHGCMYYLNKVGWNYICCIHTYALLEHRQTRDHKRVTPSAAN